MAGRPSHDAGDDGRHAALHRTRVGDRNFLRLHPIVESQDFALDRGGLGLPMQQDCGGDRGHDSRRADFCDAGGLFCRIQIRLLDAAPAAAGAPNPFSFRVTRLSELEYVPAAGLAGIHRLTVPGNSVGGFRVLSDANADQPGADAPTGGLEARTPFFPAKRHKSCIRKRENDSPLARIRPGGQL